MKKTHQLKVVSFLASGRGSNFQAVADKIKTGFIPAKPGILICDKPDALAFEKAKKLGIDSEFVDPGRYASKTDYEKEIIRIMDSVETDFIVAAGYMRILSPHIISAYRNRMINIHPSLLPSFAGKDAQRQAIEYGVRITGCTTHFIDEGMDTGPVILQRSVNIDKDDTVATLSERILKEEHIILPLTVKLLCEGRIQVEERRVIINNQ